MRTVFASFQLFLSGATEQQKVAVVKALGLTLERVMVLAHAADPTPEKRFEAWVLKQMKFKNIRLPEDGFRVRQVLQNFVFLSRKPGWKGSKDINSFERIHDLESILDPLLQGELKTEESPRLKEVLDLPGTSLLAQSPKWVIIEVNDGESAARIAKKGEACKWCTEAPATALEYIQMNDGLFIVFARHGSVLEKKYQFTGDLTQFMDLQDVPVREIPFSLAQLMDELATDLPEDTLLAPGNIAIRLVSKGYQDLSPKLIELVKRDAYFVTHYPQFTKERFLEGEKYLHGNNAFQYMQNLGQPIPELEEEIKGDSRMACLYAIDLLKRRFPPAEKGIMAEIKDYHYVSAHAMSYLRAFFPRGWDEVEPLIFEFCPLEAAFEYCREIKRIRWPELEERVLRNPETWVHAETNHYLNAFVRRVDSFSAPILLKWLTYGGWDEYAKAFMSHYLRERWPELEQSKIFQLDAKLQETYGKILKSRGLA